ncbi:MAG: hypothetical protein IJO48_01055, partial [Clostridia bacterium]|nr:hypothetical protein [Clostridia bacterium]
TGSGFATEGLITDEITFGDIFNAEHFINTSWNCTLDKGTYTVSFSGVPLSDCDYHVTKISVDIETPVSLDGSVSVSFFSMELEDGSLHSFRIDDSNVNTRNKTLVRTHQAFETYISMIFPDLAEQTAESAANADENNGTAEGENTSSARRRIFVM